MMPSAPPEDRIPLAFIGLGAIGDKKLKAIDGTCFRLVAVADNNPTNTIQLPPGATLDRDWHTVLDNRNVGAVFVSTPLPTHFEIAAAALDAGKHVLLEKPAAQNPEEFRRLVERAYRSSGRLVVAFHAAFAPDLQWFVERFGEYGALTGIHCGFFDPYLRLAEPEVANRFASLGGSWLDSGVNALSVVASLVDLGSLEIHSALFGRVPLFPADVQASVSFSWANAAGCRSGTGVIDTSWAFGVSQKTTRLAAGQLDGELLLDHTAQRVVQWRSRGERQILFASSGDRLVNHYKGVFDAFGRHIMAGTDNLVVAQEIHRLLYQAMFPV